MTSLRSSERDSQPSSKAPSSHHSTASLNQMEIDQAAGDICTLKRHRFADPLSAIKKATTGQNGESEALAAQRPMQVPCDSRQGSPELEDVSASRQQRLPLATLPVGAPGTGGKRLPASAAEVLQDAESPFNTDFLSLFDNIDPLVLLASIETDDLNMFLSGVNTGDNFDMAALVQSEIDRAEGTARAPYRREVESQPDEIAEPPTLCPASEMSNVSSHPAALHQILGNGHIQQISETQTSDMGLSPPADNAPSVAPILAAPFARFPLEALLPASTGTACAAAAPLTALQQWTSGIASPAGTASGLAGTIPRQTAGQPPGVDMPAVAPPHCDDGMSSPSLPQSIPAGIAAAAAIAGVGGCPASSAAKVTEPLDGEAVEVASSPRSELPTVPSGDGDTLMAIEAGARSLEQPAKATTSIENMNDAVSAAGSDSLPDATHQLQVSLAAGLMQIPAYAMHDTDRVSPAIALATAGIAVSASDDGGPIETLRIDPAIRNALFDEG